MATYAAITEMHVGQRFYLERKVRGYVGRDWPVVLATPVVVIENKVRFDITDEDGNLWNSLTQADATFELID